MDGHIILSDHSDSDSGESWTILEHSPQYAEDVPDFPRDITERLTFTDKDEDTDGISILSDSDHESTVYLKNNEEANIKEEFTESYMPSNKPQISNLDENLNFEGSLNASDDFLLDSNGRLKTYVHRRNKRLSTILNIIMLGSVITAAGVAIGHMWGAKNDCVMHSTPSVNKILSNLYKLQEENAYLRSKLKELTSLSNLLNHQQKGPSNQQRCKKVFEEPLNIQSANKATKCIDGRSSDDTILESHLTDPTFEKEFLSDMNKVKATYEKNKQWLDGEISKRLQFEGQQVKYLQKKEKPTKQKPFKENKTLNANSKPVKGENLTPLESSTILSGTVDSKQHESHTVKKVSYADSLKKENTQKLKGDRKIENDISEKFSKKKPKKVFEPRLENVPSEEEIKKDDRYKSHKSKYNRRKTEKWHKKQTKRIYVPSDIEDELKVFDGTNSKQQESDVQKTYQDSNVHEMYQTDNAEALKEAVNFEKNRTKKKTNINNSANERGWYEKRASMRKESRKKLELELFGEKSLNDSGWYFRRMKRREQCRAKAYNSTNKKNSKLNMNFKMKF